jgi:hypothetical protein
MKLWAVVSVAAHRSSIIQPSIEMLTHEIIINQVRVIAAHAIDFLGLAASSVRLIIFFSRGTARCLP